MLCSNENPSLEEKKQHGQQGDSEQSKGPSTEDTFWKIISFKCEQQQKIQREILWHQSHQMRNKWEALGRQYFLHRHTHTHTFEDFEK